ncbi:N-acetyltransferase [Streptacidiphilus sp. P02-A3a]|uniref:GNAT family N-acetyltransferase n=1 Tax=Streptacidiphilus sp. P02-A3a TaxID=2704468 RepID=UPI0015FDA6A8|nr:GNAT family N-acetyltransferase [Streptacidiphilus sp. P02-A3a]QMU72774.1 GNAT family N-acetyltransferase [Streptacidiphilus sp. P02-A3a]
MGEQAAVHAAGAADVEAAVAMWTLSHVVRRNGRPLPEAHVELARKRMSVPGALLLLARAEEREGAPVTVASGAPGAVVGTILGVPGLDRDGAGPPVPGLLHISLLSVAPDRWGQRIGRTLVDQVLALASTRGYEQAQLWTHADNLRANRLYKSMGFRRSGRVKIDDWGELLVHYRRAVSV